MASNWVNAVHATSVNAVYSTRSAQLGEDPALPSGRSWMCSDGYSTADST